MPSRIQQITLTQFRLLARPAQLQRTITEVHVHHTWRPTRHDFRGVETIEAMRQYHMQQNHWSDIAQHLTIDPTGGLWTGRNWNIAPASAKGFNGTSASGPFMFEMIGDFDKDADAFEGAQREAAVGVVAHLLHAFELPPAKIRFHRDMTTLKSCPGTAIDKPGFVTAVNAALKQLKSGKTAQPSVGLFTKGYLAEFPVLDAVPAGSQETMDETVPESSAAGAAIDDIARRSRAARQRSLRVFPPASVAAAGSRGNADWSDLSAHVVNLTRGELSDDGEMTTTPADLDRIVDAIREHAQTHASPRVLLYAHGGLVDAPKALAYARAMRPWWLKHDVYPVFFIWHTGLIESLRHLLLGRRDFTEFTDAAIELFAAGLGSKIWGEMKNSALRASSPDIGHGLTGGAYMFASRLARLLGTPDGKKLTVHLVGHSAGAIFHAYLADALINDLKVASIASMDVLAPAIRTDLFHGRVISKIPHDIKRLSVFTMEDAAERADICATVYRKSLLYLISRSFENGHTTPLLGLVESLSADKLLSKLFGLKNGVVPPGTTAGAELQQSYALGTPENPLTRALHHGDFDDDSKTMAAVLRRIVGVDDSTQLGEQGFPFPPHSRELEWPLAPAPFVRRDDFTRSAAPMRSARSSARGRALCVGIDDYPAKPLSGCVRDMQTWGSALSALGFEVMSLQNRDATRDNMMGALRDLVSSASPESPVVFQYSGHGTQLPDLNRDESDGYDEALVPVDYDSGAFLLDDDVASILSGLAPGAVATLFMDCCHAGTNSRFAPLVRGTRDTIATARFLPATPAMRDAHEAFRRLRAARVETTQPNENSLPGVLHFAACTDDEFAWESNGQGEFTASAVPLLTRAAHDGMTNEAFMATVRADVMKRRSQHPQLMRADASLLNAPILALPINRVGLSTSTYVTAPPPPIADALRGLQRAVDLLSASLGNR